MPKGFRAFCFAALAAFAATTYAQVPSKTLNGNIEWPSPDGAFAFVTSYGEDIHSIDLIDKNSGKRLQRIDEQDSSLASWHVLWAPDSKRFALMTRSGHPIQGVDVYSRNGDAFQKTELHLPDATIPEKLKHGRNFPHFANLNWQEAKEWKKNGSLVVTVTTMVDGEGDSITATRAVTVSFDRVGHPRIVNSTISYKSEHD